MPDEIRPVENSESCPAGPSDARYQTAIKIKIKILLDGEGSPILQQSGVVARAWSPGGDMRMAQRAVDDLSAEIRPLRSVPAPVPTVSTPVILTPSPAASPIESDVRTLQRAVDDLNLISF